MLPATFVLILVAIVLPMLPRRYVPVTFLLAVTLIPPTAHLQAGPLHFYPLRVMVLAGLARMLINSERPPLFPQRLDKIMLAFGLICMASSVFHKNPGDAFVYRTAMTLDWVGTCFLFRTWIESWEDVQLYLRSVIIVMIPFAISMLIEKLTGHNLFSWFAGLRAESAMREGHVRASGPFVNYITAGTIGAVCLALAFSLRGDNKRLARVGIVGCLVIAYASTSSGPLLTCAAGFLALWLWRYRVRLRSIIWSCIAVLFVLHMVKHRPIWFLMDLIDLVGGSSGWYRAMLISRAIEYLNEWWLAGTDYTVHWMATGTHENPDMCDLVNNYIFLGVIGGLPLMLTFIWVLRECFRQISKASRSLPESSLDLRYKLWCLGSCLFAHCVTFVSMAYYDEATAYLYSLVGVIGSGCAVLVSEPYPVTVVTADEPEPASAEYGKFSTPVSTAPR